AEDVVGLAELLQHTVELVQRADDVAPYPHRAEPSRLEHRVHVRAFVDERLALRGYAGEDGGESDERQASFVRQPLPRHARYGRRVEPAAQHAARRGCIGQPATYGFLERLPEGDNRIFIRVAVHRAFRIEVPVAPGIDALFAHDHGM